MAINPPWPGLMRGDAGTVRSGISIYCCVLSTYIPLELGGAGKLALDQGGGYKTAETIIIIDNIHRSKEAAVLYLVRPKDLTRVTCVLAGLLVVTRGSGSTCTSPNIRLVRA